MGVSGAGCAGMGSVCVCVYRGAGSHRRAVGNALFSFPLQKTGHSRRFGRFTHGALSYQDPTPPLPRACWGGVPAPPCKGQRAEAGQGWTASCQPQNRVPGAHSAPHAAGLLLALQLYSLRGCQAVVARMGNLMHWQCVEQLLVCWAAEGRPGVGETVWPSKCAGEEQWWGWGLALHCRGFLL